MDELVEHSRAIIEQGSKSFAAAARLFAPETRAGAYLLYAWCRHCDDRTDDQELGFESSRLEPAEARARLIELETKTVRALDGEAADDPVFAGLQEVVRRYEIPPRFALEHLQGFRMDVEGFSYRTFDDTLLYCYHVAGVVGLMMAYIMGVRDEPTLDRACDLGLAFQLTNICRDVLDDDAVGRVYLPSEWLAEAGIDDHDLADPTHRAALVAVVRRTLAEAERYYDSARLGIARLPLRSAWAIAAARAVYRHIGRMVTRRGASAWDTRASTSTPRKLGLVLAGVAEATAARAFRRDGRVPERSGLWQRPRTPETETAQPRTAADHRAEVCGPG